MATWTGNGPNSKTFVYNIKTGERSWQVAVSYTHLGYDASWVEEAARRGLLNLSSTVDALPYYCLLYTSRCV